MNSIVRNVADLSADERHVYEDALGQPLRAHQQVIVQLVDVDAGQGPNAPAPAAPNGADQLPDWCTIWADLSDEEVADLESAILDRSDSRPS
jgi:hypothetical protein